MTIPLGAEWVGAVSSRDLLIAVGADGFAAEVRRVFGDPDLGAALALLRA